MDDRALIALCSRLASMRARENALREEIARAETELVAATGFAKPEGQETYRASHGNTGVRFELRQNVYTSIDAGAWLALRRSLPTSHPGRGIFRQKFDLDMRAARELQANDRMAWMDVAPVITRTPGKVSVSIKELVLGGEGVTQEELEELSRGD